MRPPDPERCERLLDAIVDAAKDGGYEMVELACAVATLYEILASGQFGVGPATAIALMNQARKASAPS